MPCCPTDNPLTRPGVPGRVAEDARFPNLFLVGPHKTGTTSWHEALDAHPDVFMSELKEPEFLNQDHDYAERPIETEAAYLALFEDAGEVARLGEATPWYFYSDAAADAIRERAEDPRVLIVLRDPVERIHSLHQQRVTAGTETIEEFEEALAAEPDRKAGRRVPERANPVRGNFYREIARYAPNLERYRDRFDDDELLVLKFEDVVEDPDAAFEQVCRFLDLDPTVDAAFPDSNPTTEARSHAFRELVRDPPAPVQALTGLFPVAWRDRLRNLLLDANERQTTRDPLDPELREELVDELEDDIAAVEAMLGWDCEDWRRVETPNG